MVALKYGAKKAAMTLREQMDIYAISTTIVWVQHNLLQDRQMIDFLDKAVAVVSTTGGEINESSINAELEIFRDKAELDSTEVGCLVSRHPSPKLVWNPDSDASKKMITTSTETSHTSLNNLNFLKELSELTMQSSDMSKVGEARQTLKSGRALAVCPDCKSKDANSYSRCQAVALNAFASLILKESDTTCVAMRVANSDDMDKAQAQAEGDNSRMLLWVDMLTSKVALRRADRGSTFSYRQRDNSEGKSKGSQVILVNGLPQSVTWGTETPAFVEEVLQVVSVKEGGHVKLGDGTTFRNPLSTSSWDKNLQRRFEQMLQAHSNRIQLLLTSDKPTCGFLEETVTNVSKSIYKMSNEDLRMRLSATNSKDSIKACALHEEIRWLNH